MKAIFLLLLMSIAVFGAALDIAVRGQAPQYSIVIRGGDDKPMEHAAKEFQTFVKQMTGVSLPIEHDDKPLPKAAILIGDTRHTRALLGKNFDLHSLGDDAFRLKAVDGHIVVLGGKRGAHYGVYELLERFGGCRWYASWHSRIPSLERFSIPSNLDETQRPAFLSREPFWFDMFNANHALRNKCNGFNMHLRPEQGGSVRFGGGLFVHSMERLLPIDEFLAKHKEYYCELNGKRTIDVGKARGNVQPCLSNPDVLKIVTERVLERIRKDPDADLYAVGMNDNRNGCQCSQCNIIKEKTGGEAGILLWFVNQLAEAVEKEFPNAMILTDAYEHTQPVPDKIKPRHNVAIRLSTIACDHAHPIRQCTSERTKAFLKDLDGWSKITNKLFIWDYITNFSHYIAPYPNYSALHDNLRLFRDSNVIGVLSQGDYNGHHGDFAELKGWILAKLMWNPEQDAEALLDDFMEGYYGKAAPYVREYFNAMNALSAPPDVRLGVYYNITDGPLTNEFLDWAANVWEKAEEAVKDDPAFLYNVRCGAMTVAYARLFRLPKMEPSYKWLDGALAPSDDFALCHSLAKRLLPHFESPVGGRIVRCSEGKGRDAKAEFIRSLCMEYGVKTVRRDGMAVGVSPDFGGTAGRLAFGYSRNLLNGDNGGISCRLLPFDSVDVSAPRKFTLSETAEDAVSCTSKVDGKWLQRNEFRINGEELQAAFKVTFDEKYDKPQARAYTLAFDLDVGLDACYRLDGSKWEPLPLGEEGFGFKHLDANDLKDCRTIALASPKSGLAVEIAIGKVHSTGASIMLNPSRRLIKLTVYDESPLMAGDSSEASFRIRRLENAALPVEGQSRLSTAVRISVPSSKMTLIRRGVWGDFVPDSKATDGLAIKLFSTHFQWALRVPVNLSNLTAGQKYSLRFRIKVAKRKEAGQAFQVGIYNETTEASIGNIAPDVKSITDGEYHWYTVAAWVPNPSHKSLIWGAPGNFSADGAAAEAFIDRMEIIPVD